MFATVPFTKVWTVVCAPHMPTVAHLLQNFSYYAYLEPLHPIGLQVLTKIDTTSVCNNFPV